ncbi:hypothetical protein [Haloferax sp. YSSS75]|uniref:hypothetical protein n=1 Tax=Haloferax sp. YSSS75 TaxID=3388564 RepID=UPI00398CEFD2
MNGSHRSQKALVGVLVMLVVLAIIPGLATAKTEVGPTVVVERGERLTDDLTVAAGTVIVRGTVEGDVTALAGDVVVAGEVTGDVTALAGRVEVTGEVGGKVTAFGGVTTVSGTVGDGIDAIGGALQVSGAVSGTVDAISVLVTVEEGATVDGRLQTTAVRTHVNGSVSGEPETAVNQSNVGASDSPSPPSLASDSPSSIRESPVAALPPRLTMHPPSGVSTLVATTLTPVQLQILPFGISFLDAYGFFVNLLLGVLLIGVLPRFSTRVASRVVEDPVRTAGFGLATTIVVPIVLVLFGISLFGLPLALAGGALAFVLWWVGAVYGRFAVGVWLIGAIPRGAAYVDVDVEPIENRWVSLFVGIVVVSLLVAVPVIGPVVDTAVAILGVGALVRLVYHAYTRTERVTPVETDAPDVLVED